GSSQDNSSPSPGARWTSLPDLGQSSTAKPILCTSSIALQTHTVSARCGGPTSLVAPFHTQTSTPIDPCWKEPWDGTLPARKVNHERLPRTLRLESSPVHKGDRRLRPLAP